MGSQQQMSDLVRGDVSQDGVEAHRESFLQVFHRFNEDVAVGALAILRKVGDAKGFRNESPRLFFDTKHQHRLLTRAEMSSLGQFFHSASIPARRNTAAASSSALRMVPGFNPASL